MRKTSGSIDLSEVKIPAVFEAGEEIQANWAIYLFYFQFLAKEVHNLTNDVFALKTELKNDLRGISAAIAALAPEGAVQGDKIIEIKTDNPDGVRSLA